MRYMPKDTASVSLPRPASAKASAGRPPIVAVLGHIDHGKTSLLDYIRKTTVAASEHGGITQRIGAYQVEVKRKKAVPAGRQEKGKSEEGIDFITFIDTPGHEAFAAMRGRGANVADIAILVVAADDSVKPQTIESIEQIKKAGVSLIVAVNKTDLPTANIDRVKADLAKAGVQVEGFGGDVPLVPISAKTGKGVDKLLEMIILVSQMKEFSADPNTHLVAVVIETKLDKGRGMVASVIVTQGTLKAGDDLYMGEEMVGRVRAMFDEYSKPVIMAGPSKPVEVLGFTKLPPVGEQISNLKGKTERKVIVKLKEKVLNEIPDFLKPVADQEEQKLNVVLKVDTAGSLEAIVASLHPRIRIVSSGVGEINEADILHARSTHSFIIGFNVKLAQSAEKLAQTEKVICRIYTIIYELLEELKEVVLGMKEVLTKERELGIGQIIAEFPYERMRIAGTRVAEGRLARGDTVKLMRGQEEVGRARIKSIRKGKDDTTKVEKGGECGVLFDKTLDFLLGDAIIAVTST